MAVNDKVKHVGVDVLVTLVVLIMGIALLCFIWMMSGQPLKTPVINQQMTLELPNGTRTGTYTGSTSKNLPDGYGRFSSRNEDGTSWTYKGDFSKGLFDGKGSITWSDGYSQKGTYERGYLVKGQEVDRFGNILYDGSFTKSGTHRENVFSRTLRKRSIKQNSFEASWDDIASGALLGESVRIRGTVSYIYLSERGGYVDYYVALEGDPSHLVLCSYEGTRGESRFEEGDPVFFWGYLEGLDYTSQFSDGIDIPAVYVVTASEDKETARSSQATVSETEAEDAAVLEGEAGA